MVEKMRSVALFRSVALVAIACLVLPCQAVGQAVPTATPAQAPAGGYPRWPPNVTSDLIPYLASREPVVGPSRILVNVIDQQNRPMQSPTRPVTLNFYDL